MINQKDELDIREGDIVQSKIKCVVRAKGQCVLNNEEREREREKIVIKTIKREDIIGNDDEDFVLIGWQTLINAFTKLLLPTTKWDISTDTILVL